MIDAIGYLILGFAAGYVWSPVWTLLKKIWVEVRQAQQEWKK